MRRVLCIAAVSSLLAAVSLGGLGQGSCVVTVEPGESIQAAIDAASEGTVICLAAGEWNENLLIEKSLTLRGQGSDLSTVFGKEEWAPVVRIAGSDGARVSIEGLAIAGAANAANLVVGGQAELILKACVVEAGTMEGLYLWGGARAALTGCSIRGHAGAGIYLLDTSEVTIASSSVSENSSGLALTGSAQATVSSSAVRANRSEGMILWDTSRASLTASTIADNGANGINVLDDAQVSVTDSTVEANAGMAGISVLDSAQVVVTGSTVRGNGWCGIYAAVQPDVSLVSTKLLDNAAYGICLYERPCFDVDNVFRGHIAGRDNVIPGPDAPDGNGTSAFCGAQLPFLTTEIGGELDRR